MGALSVPVGGARLMEGSALDRDERVAQLFDAHYLPMCRLAYVILGDRAVAEEIVMEALLKTFSGWWRIRDRANIDAYLKRAVVNLCRSRIRRKTLESRFMASHRTAETRDADHDVEMSNVVWDAVMRLPERQRAAVVLRYFDDLPEAEIAELLDCSIGTVKSQLSKARAKLSKQLGPTWRNEP